MPLASDRNTQYFKITRRSIALQFGAIALAGFYPYCYTESAIFGNGDRAEEVLIRSRSNRQKR
ncbi:hypothetical protein QUA04_27620 [Microcoleus sp. S13_C5]